MKTLLLAMLLCLGGCEPSNNAEQLKRMETKLQTMLERTALLQNRLNDFDAKCERHVTDINFHLLKIENGNPVTVQDSFFYQGEFSTNEVQAVLKKVCGDDVHIHKDGSLVEVVEEEEKAK